MSWALVELQRPFERMNIEVCIISEKDEKRINNREPAPPDQDLMRLVKISLIFPGKNIFF
jgi:hypothetical protein